MVGFAFASESAGTELMRISTWVLGRTVLAVLAWAAQAVREPERRGRGLELGLVRVRGLVRILQQRGQVQAPGFHCYTIISLARGQSIRFVRLTPVLPRHLRPS